LEKVCQVILDRHEFPAQDSLVAPRTCGRRNVNFSIQRIPEVVGAEAKVF